MATTSPTPVPLSQESIQNALAQMSQWFPEHQANINQYSGQIVQNMLNNTAPAPGTPLAQLTKTSAATPTSMVMAAVSAPSTSSFTPCDSAILNVALDAALLALDITGIEIARDEINLSSFASVCPTKGLNDVRYAAYRFAAATPQSMEQARTVFDILGSLWTGGGHPFKVIFDTFEENASWFEWITTGVTAVAQFTIWLASDGVAFVARVVLALADAVTLVEDVRTLNSTCELVVITPTTATVFMPLGSYVYSSTSASVTVFANCKNTASQWVSAAINLSNFPVTCGLDNTNGGLMVSPTAVPAPSTFTPNGSYAQSSQNIKVVLQALCTNAAGSKVVSSLDITNLGLGQTVSNINGVLTADSQ